MIATDVTGTFLVPLKVTLMAAFLIALPYVLWQAWAFVAPGLYQHEKRLALPVIVSSCLFFLVGMAFAYFFVFPVAFGFFAGYTPAGVQMMTDIDKYLSFVLTMFIAFGLTFEVPVVVIVLVRLRVVSLEKLRAIRSYVIVGAFVDRRDLHAAGRGVAADARGAAVAALRARASSSRGSSACRPRTRTRRRRRRSRPTRVSAAAVSRRAQRGGISFSARVQGARGDFAALLSFGRRRLPTVTSTSTSFPSRATRTFATEPGGSSAIRASNCGTLRVVLPAISSTTSRSCMPARSAGTAALHAADHARPPASASASAFATSARHRLRLDAEPAARHLAVLDDLLEHVARERHGDRERRCRASRPTASRSCC